MDSLEEKTVKSETIFEGKIVKLVVDDVVLPNGAMSKREIVKHPGAVAVIAITPENKMIMVEQFRKPLENTIVEIPAGKIEPNEAPELTAGRELEEETGYKTEDLTHLVSFYTSPGFADELLHIYLAGDIHKQANPLQADEDEFVNILEVSLDEALQLIEENVICDAKTVYAVQYWQLRNAIN
ncbi:ADP-ribose pyrophosphatase [Listeria weihenstephanensis FSL R9-0317]|uniref:ADP-ribose pyrophosphatase n=1 Tax=Listeria weihenstephanensis TaxID=1006155 RepID=A0A1S7FTT0_9LIST|nr:NUDIX hydrolase [Listeria weihenstephanensis]AQY50745.1 ADP-ribose pyrophosphatase [Listeria weihenstephanensis]EUJ36159.1 ADP-ribose pyrophosphatase [Listeria weihenstephanensis FSL R9-0317]MBC1499503.1 NUDIX hydrolase [Listeria weihenstephanensis]